MSIFTRWRDRAIKKALQAALAQLKERLLVLLGRLEEKAAASENKIDDKIVEALRDLIETL